MDTITTTQSLLKCNGCAQPVMVSLTANEARLIAAAPELLAALKAAMDFIDDVSVADQDITDETRRAWDALQKVNPRAAIAKAEGGQDE